MEHKSIKKFSAEEENYILSQYSQNRSLSSIAKELKTGHGTAKRVLLKHGIKFERKRKYALNVEYFKEINTPEKAYWLGFIAADGCLLKDKTGFRLGFNISRKDPDILEKFKRAIGYNGPILETERFEPIYQKTYYQYQLRVCSTEFCNYIRAHGVDENKSKDMNFPIMDECLYPHFIRGMYDGDGSVSPTFSPKEGRVKFNVNLITTLSCAEFIQDFLTSRLNYKMQKLTVHPCGWVFYLNFAKMAMPFLKWLYSESTPETRLDRKYDIFTKYLPQFENQRPLRERFSYKIIHVPSQTIYEIHNLKDFLKEKGLSKTMMLDNFQFKTKTKTGKHSEWEIIERTQNF